MNGQKERFQVPEILVCTPRAAAQGLAPCQSEDEMARKQALKRIKDVEVWLFACFSLAFRSFRRRFKMISTQMVVFDEADLLLDFGSQCNDVQIVLTAIAASFPNQARLVQPKAQVR